MTYTSKSTTTIKDPALTMDQKIVKLSNLYAHDHMTSTYHPYKVQALRKQHKEIGGLLDRTFEISWNDMAIYTIMVWASKEAYDNYVNDPVYVEYVSEMEKDGYSVVDTEVV